jgi:hypothetical protein
LARDTLTDNSSSKICTDQLSWNTSENFNLYLDSVLYLPSIKDSDKLFFKIAVAHGQEILCMHDSEKIGFERLGKLDSSLKLNQMINTQLKLSKMHRYSRLIISLFCSTKKKKDFFSIGWISLNLFDYKSQLINGKIKLHLWQTNTTAMTNVSCNSASSNSFLGQCQSCVSDQNPDKDFVRLNVEFLKNVPNQSNIFYPSHEYLTELFHKPSSYTQDEVIFNFFKPRHDQNM